MLKDILHWAFAAVIAGAIAWTFLFIHMRDTEQNCLENQCHVDIDKRLAALEAAMLVRTQDRYTGTDAKRDLLIINQRIDALHERMDRAER